MVLSSPAFFALFGVVFALWYLAPARLRWLVLLAGNCVFYGLGATPTLWWSLAVSVLLSWGVSLAMEKTKSPTARKALLWLGLAGVLGFLLAFKYLGFFTAGRLTLGLAQPVGISFYTMQTVAYLVDVYRGRLTPERHLGFYAAYVTFFATLTSGPIARAEQVLPQLHAACERKRPFDGEQATKGLVCLLLGMYEKCALAYVLGGKVTLAFGAPETVIGTSLILAAVLYSLQLYYDFAGYSNMAVGLGWMLGLDLPQNFRQPYLALTIKEFWSRWHISLSGWLRDYVYIPLGGSRRGSARTLLNLLLTFLVSGLWHGAGLCFLVWGGLHGLYQMAGRVTGKFRDNLYNKLKIQQNVLPVRLWKMGFTFVIVTFAWVFFYFGTAGATLPETLAVIARMGREFTLSPRAWINGLAMIDIRWRQLPLLGALLLLAAVPDLLGRHTSPEDWLMTLPVPVRAVLCWVFVGSVLLFGSTVVSSIYFNF